MDGQNMNTEEALAYIESPRFDAELNVVSGSKAFFRAVANEPAVQISLSSLRESGPLREEVLGRICDLAASETDPRYENPNDSALAALLWLTCFADPDFARLGAHYVERAPRCWYARKLACQIINPTATGSTMSSVRSGLETQASIKNSSFVKTVDMVPSAPRARFVSVRLSQGHGIPESHAAKSFDLSMTANTEHSEMISPPSQVRDLTVLAHYET